MTQKTEIPGPIIAIVGPTASGKTALAVEVARHLDGEILSADSRQVYRGMDIGTGKDLEDYAQVPPHTGPDGKTIAGKPAVPYHLIDIAEAGEEFNIFRYQQAFDGAYEDICKRGRAPVLCGGSGLYITAALGNKNFREVPENKTLRAELSSKSDSELEAILRTFGPLHNHTDTETRERCLRAIEILSFEKEHPAPERNPPTAKIFGISFEPEILRGRILQRLEQRLENGMVEEVQALLQQGLRPQQLLYYGLEYKFLTEYITGRRTYDEMKTGLYHAICQFAKRQRTWFRKMEKDGYRISWIDGTRPLDEKLSKILSAISR